MADPSLGWTGQFYSLFNCIYINRLLRVYTGYSVLFTAVTLFQKWYQHFIAPYRHSFFFFVYSDATPLIGPLNMLLKSLYDRVSFRIWRMTAHTHIKKRTSSTGKREIEWSCLWNVFRDVECVVATLSLRRKAIFFLECRLNTFGTAVPFWGLVNPNSKWFVKPNSKWFVPITALRF